MAIATLLVLDASLPGGFIPGNGNLRYAQTMTFTCLTLAQFFNVFNSRSDRSSAFAGIFSNRWVWGALVLSLLLQLMVTYVPVMQQAFGTTPLSLTDWVKCLIPASAVLWMRELWKLLRRGSTHSRANA